MFLISLVKQIFCEHKEQEHLMNIYGDYINYISPINKTYRSIWKCKKCDKIIYKEILGPEKKINLDMEMIFKNENLGRIKRNNI